MGTNGSRDQSPPNNSLRRMADGLPAARRWLLRGPRCDFRAPGVKLQNQRQTVEIDLVF